MALFCFITIREADKAGRFAYCPAERTTKGHLLRHVPGQDYFRPESRSGTHPSINLNL
jgi:hypothetical protein